MKKIKILILVLFILFGFGSLGAYGYMNNETNKWASVILPGVTIENIDVSGKTTAEAKALLKQKYGDAILKKNLEIKAQGKTYTLDYSRLKATYDIDAKVDQAFQYGKKLSMLDKYKLIKKPVSKVLKLDFSYNEAAISDLISSMKKDIDISPEEGSVQLLKGNFTVIPDKKGQKLDAEKLKAEVKSKINGDLNSNISVDANIVAVEANKTAEKLSKIDTKISSFTTNFAGSSAARINNITLATGAINGTVLMPGDKFSFNGIVGERTVQRGYQAAPVIIGNKVESGLGGGICQVSTTLYNSILRTQISYKDMSRQNHTLPSHYVPLGMDATVDYSSGTDYKFTNTFDCPIYIEGYISKSSVYFNIYSNSSLTSKSYDIVSEKIETMEPKIIYVDDSTLAAGTEQVEQNASTGYKVKVYKITYENGSTGSKDLLYSDTYNAVNKIIKRGTKTS